MVKRLSIEDLNDDFFGVVEDFLKETRMIFGYNREHFLSAWKHFYSMGIASIFALCDGDGRITGALGGCIFPDVHGGEPIATELFWFVGPEHRGKGLRLLTEFEDWAKERRVKRVVMMHLADLMPGKLDKLYHRRGYVLAELSYVKEV